MASLRLEEERVSSCPLSHYIANDLSTVLVGFSFSHNVVRGFPRFALFIPHSDLASSVPRPPMRERSVGLFLFTQKEEDERNKCSGD